MAENETRYDISIKVKSLDDVTKIITFLKDSGFTDISFYTSRPTEVVEGEREERAKRRYSDLILLSLYTAKARSEESAVDVDEIIALGRKNLRPRMVYVLFDNEGIAKRTINMIATAILADKYGYIEYTKSEPKKFWLTPKGIEKVPGGVL
jgi:hypothetical protein